MTTKDENKILWIMFGVAIIMLFVGLSPMVRVAMQSQQAVTPTSIVRQITPTPSVTPIPLKIYTQEEVAKHNTQNNCWVVIKGYVYDAGKMVEKIGNSQQLKTQFAQLCGQDATATLNQILQSQNLSMFASTLDRYLLQSAIGKVSTSQ